MGSTYANEFVGCVQVRHKSTIYFDKWLGGRRGRDSDEVREIQKTAYSGQMTDGAEKRIRKAIDLLLQLSPERIIYNPVLDVHHPFTINFITLTVSDPIIQSSKKVQKECLQPWLNWLRKKGNDHYIWKAELQKRGQVHYHITTNQFIHYEEIRKAWNRYQRKAGFLDSYAKTNKHYNANSTDVHSVINVKDIESYLVKYICKSVGDASIDGKIWGCSKSLSNPYFYTEMNESNLPVKRDHNFIEKERFAIYRKAGFLVLDKFQQQEYVNYISSL